MPGNGQLPAGCCRERIRTAETFTHKLVHHNVVAEASAHDKQGEKSSWDPKFLCLELKMGKLQGVDHSADGCR